MQDSKGPVKKVTHCVLDWLEDQSRTAQLIKEARANWHTAIDKRMFGSEVVAVKPSHIQVG